MARDSKVTLPSGETIITEAPEDGEYYGRVDGRWDFVTEEAPIDGKTYARYEGNWVEVTGATVALTVTEIVPAIANTGSTANITASVFGTGFTANTDVYWGNLAIPTAFVSANELSITIDPSLGLAPSVVYVTVQDGATVGTGAAGFHFVAPGTGADAGLGLSMDKTTTPNPTINLQPAGDGPPTLGGVYVVDRVRNVSEGLELGIDGRLRAPLATDSLAGTILEPPPDDKGYVRRRDLAGVSQWVPPADTLIDFGTGLTKDETATPPIVHLQPALDWAIGGIMEPAQDGLAYSRQFDTTTQTWLWTPAITAGLQITSLIPDKAIYGNSEPLLTVHAYGSEFTPTTLAVIDGTDMVTTVLSTTELTFVLNPAVPVSEQFHIITVRDPAAVPPDLAVGLGAEQFDFIKATTEVDYGTGLSLDTNPTPPMVHLQPAGWDQSFLGGVWTTGGRSATEGLDLDAMGTGKLSVPLATPDLAGSIVEPIADAKGYVRTTQLNGVSQWVPPAETLTDFGTGLYKDETAVPPMVHLQPAGDSPATLGGVYVIDRQRNVEEGLELGIDGRLRAPLATPNLAGTIVEPFPDAKGYVRTTQLDGTSMWVPPADTPGYDYGTGLAVDRTPVPPDQPIVNLTPAGDAPAFLGGVYVVDRERNVEEGLELGLDGRLRAPLATPRLAGTIVEPEDDGKGYVRTTLNGVSMWVPPADTLTDYGTGLYKDETATPAIVHLQPAGVAPNLLGGVYVPTRDATQAADVDTNGGDGRLVVLTATNTLLGGMLEPPLDGLPYERQWNEIAQVWEWAPAKPGADFGTGLWVDDTQTPPLVHLQPAGDGPATLGGVYVIDRERNVSEGLELGLDGRLRAPLATPRLAGSIVEPEDDGKGYVRTTLNGVSMWVPPADTPLPDFGLGLSLDETQTPQIVHLTPAGWAPQWLGGVYGSERTATQGLDLAAAGTGELSAPLATDLLAGTHTEPPPDGLAYSRQWDATLGWIWVPALTAGLHVSEILPDRAIIDPAALPVTVHVFGGHFTATTVVALDGVDTATTFVSINELTYIATPAAETVGRTVIVTVHDGATPGSGADAFEFIVSSTLVDYGIGIDLDPATTPNPTVNLKPANFNGEIGGVKVVGRGPTQGLELAVDGTIWAPLATDIEAGTIVEPPPDDMLYVRTRTVAGVSSWVPNAAGADFGVGLAVDRTATPPIVNLTPAGDAPAFLGGVYVIDRQRNVSEGLELSIDGRLRAPLATPRLAGTIVEPEDDGKGYVRTTLNGVSMWVPPADSPGGVTISDTPPLNPAHEDQWWESDTGAMFIYYDDGSSGQWVQTNGETTPPTVYVADDPPMSPTDNQLWWDSNAGSLNLWYTDVDSSQWVQVAAPQIPGVPEAPIDGVPYSRRDANWVATTSLAATPGDIKSGFQVNDHGGWILLDGRLVNTLTSTQQAQAALLGFTTNIPNADGCVIMQNGSAMGAVAGSMTKTIAQANLPAVNLTAANVTVTVNNYDFASIATDSQLNFSDTVGQGVPRGQSAVGGTGYWFISCGDENGADEIAERNYYHAHNLDLPTHTHTTAAHGHSVPLGGSGTPLDMTPKSLSANAFLFLGA